MLEARYLYPWVYIPRQSSSTHPINELTVSFNIIKNLNHHAVALNSVDKIPAGDNLISENFISNMGGYEGPPYGERRGIYLTHEQYASITNNKMDQLRDGIQISGFTRANPGAPTIVSGNEIDCTSQCISVVEFFNQNPLSPSSAPSLLSNTIDNGTAGISLGTIQNDQTLTVSQNISAALLQQSMPTTKPGPCLQVTR